MHDGRDFQSLEINIAVDQERRGQNAVDLFECAREIGIQRTDLAQSRRDVQQARFLQQAGLFFRGRLGRRGGCALSGPSLLRGFLFSGKECTVGRSPLLPLPLLGLRCLVLQLGE
ncbi:hypothetical protein [Frankia sp. B2]|uniref:hypothetical protein n=1 Tax=Frankia sp. B2 TaxID=2541730 RepID=UPI00197A9138|nr:hypothetical protein [Frankia sp. B2]